MTYLTKDQAVDRLVHIPRDDLIELCYYAHKDQYGVKGRHLLDYSVPDLVSWYIVHYDWNEKGQYWESIQPFEDVA